MPTWSEIPYISSGSLNITDSQSDGDVNVTINNSFQETLSTDETASLIFQHNSINAGWIISDRTSSFSDSPGDETTQDSKMTFYTVEDSVKKQKLQFHGLFNYLGDGNFLTFLTTPLTGESNNKLHISSNGAVNTGQIIIAGENEDLSIIPHGTGTLLLGGSSGVVQIGSPEILDTYGNSMWEIDSTTDAVNSFGFSNSVTTKSPYLYATGDDTNIDLILKAKGSGSILIEHDGLHADQFPSKLTTSNTGDFTMENTLGDVFIKSHDDVFIDSGGNRWLFRNDDGDNTFEINDDVLYFRGSQSDVNDFFSITVGANGATTLRTADYDFLNDNDRANLTITADGYVEIKSFTDGGDTATGDDITLTSGKDIKFDAEQNIYIDSQGGNIHLKDGDSTFTPTEDSHAATKAYVDSVAGGLTTEEVQDIAGALVEAGGTKTGITITYQDATNDMDFVVDDATKLPLSGGTVTGNINMDDNDITGVNTVVTSILTMDSVDILGMKDEDDMASDSDDFVASQQSIKAYVDAQVKTTEEIQDIAGPLVATGGTKTGITVTYQDATGDMDFVVDDATKLPVSGGTMGGNLNMDGNEIDFAQGGITSLDAIEFYTGNVFNDFLDEDDMASDSNSSAASQQSIKAYVDAQSYSIGDLTDVLYSSGDLTINSLDKIITTGELAFDVVGSAKITESNTDHFIFDCDNTRIRINANPNSNNYCMIGVDADGNSTITSYGTSEDATLTLDSEGDISLNADTGAIEFMDDTVTLATTRHDTSGASPLSIFRVVNPDEVLDYFQIEVGQNGETTLSTHDSAGAALTISGAGDTFHETDRHISIKSGTSGTGGDIMFYNNTDHMASFTTRGLVLNEGGLYIGERSSAGANSTTAGQLWVKNESPNELWFTTGDDDDIQITDGTSIAGGGGGGGGTNNHIISHSARIYTRYLRWFYPSTTYGPNYYNWNSTLNSTSLQTVWYDSYNPQFVAPVAMTLKSYSLHFNANNAQTYELALLKGTGVTYGSAGNYTLSNVGTTQSEVVGTAHVLHKMEETGLSVSLSAGDILVPAIRRSTGDTSTYYYLEACFTAVLEID